MERRKDQLDSGVGYREHLINSIGIHFFEVEFVSIVHFGFLGK